MNGHGRDVRFCRYVDGSDQAWCLRAGLAWEDVRHVFADEKHPIEIETADLLPYGPSAGGVFLNGYSDHFPTEVILKRYVTRK